MTPERPTTVRPTPFLRDEAADVSAALHRLAAGIAAEKLPELIGEIERAKAVAWSRLAAPVPRAAAPEADRLLTIEEAAPKLGLSTSYLYKHSEEFPFTVRVGGRVRFAERGIDDYIRRQRKK